MSSNPGEKVLNSIEIGWTQDLRAEPTQKGVWSKTSFFKQLGPGVLTKSITERGGQLTDSVPMSTRWQPSNPRLRLGLLGCQLVDIGMKFHSVHFGVKFSSALASENLTAKCTSCKFISSRTKSNQVGLSPISSQPCVATLNSADLRLDLGRLGWT